MIIAQRRGTVRASDRSWRGAMARLSPHPSALRTLVPGRAGRPPRSGRAAAAAPWSGRRPAGSWRRRPTAARRAGAGGRRCRRPATAPWLMPRLKPCGALAARITRMACWVSAAIVGRLRRRQVGVVGDVPVRADQQVPGRVRVEVEHRVRQLAPVHDQPVRVARRRDRAERAVVRSVRRPACSRPGCRPSGAGSTAAGTRPGRPDAGPQVLHSSIVGLAGAPLHLAGGWRWRR